MPVFPWLILTFFRGTLAGPVQRAAWSEWRNPVKTKQDGAPRPPFYHLPVFLQAPGPLLARDLFRPGPHKRPLPAGLTALLLPPTQQHQSVRGTGARAVDVWCGIDKISVRMDRLQLRAWTVPSLFRLGSCEASRISPRFLYFHSKLTECDGESKVVGGQLMYTFSLYYTPPPQGYVIRVLPLKLPVHCHYNRHTPNCDVQLACTQWFHYSYQVGFRPHVLHSTFMKNIRSKLSFSLSVCNAKWEPLPSGHWFFLGDPVYFVAQTGVLLPGERLYVDSCYATSSTDPNSVPKVDIISNYGCMTDSRREGSSSRFLMGERRVLKFYVDAFFFGAVSQVLYLHCSMSVGLTTTHTSKSCNFNKAAGRWEELEAPPPVCSCCDSTCTDIQDTMKNTVSSPGWFIGQKDEEKSRMRAVSFQAEEGRELFDQEERRENSIDEHLKNVQTFSQASEIGHEEEKVEAIPEKPSVLLVARKEWRHSAAVSQQGKKEKEEGVTEQVVKEKADSQQKELKMDDISMSDQTRQEGNETVQARDEVSSTKNGSENGLSSENRSTNALRHDFGTTTITRNSSFGIDSDNGSNHGFAENISTVIPMIKPCTDGDKMSCSATNSTISVWDSRVHESLHGNRLGPLSASSNIDIDYAGFPDIRKSRKSRLKSDKSDTLLSSKRVKSANNSVDTKSNRIPGRSGINSQGPHGGDDDDDDDDDDELHSLQIRGLESGWSAHPAASRDPICVDKLICESDFDSGNEEGEALHLNPLTRAAKTKKEVQEFPGNITRPNSSGSVSSEQMHQDSPSHFAVVAVTTTLHGSESSQMLIRDSAESGWGLQILGFVAEQPNELKQEEMDTSNKR